MSSSWGNFQNWLDSLPRWFVPVLVVVILAVLVYAAVHRLHRKGGE